jgi:hypothetical protein
VGHLQGRTRTFLNVAFGLLLVAGGSSGRCFAADYHSPRTAGLGGAGRAAPLLNDSIYLNPAYGSFLPSYSLQLGLDRGTFDQDVGAGRVYHLSILDGRSPLFQAGAGYTVKQNGSYIHVGASRAFFEGTGVGIGGKFFIPNSSLPSAQDLTLGASVVFSNWIQGSVVVENMIESQAGAEARWYRDYVVAFKLNAMGIFMGYADLHYVPHHPTGDGYGHEFGLEFTLMKDLFLRLGFFKNSMKPFVSRYGNGFASGLGWIGPRMSVDYAFTRMISSPEIDTPGSAHHFGATIYF